MLEYILKGQFNNKKTYIVVAILLFIHFVILGSLFEFGNETNLQEIMTIQFSGIFFVAFLLPIYYGSFVSNIFCTDLESGQLTFIFTRGKYRISYYLSNVILLIVLSNVFIIYCSLLILVRAWLKGIEMGSFSIGMFAIQYSLLFGYLMTIGMLLFLTSIIFKNNIMGNIILFILVTLGLWEYFTHINISSINPIIRAMFLFHEPHAGELSVRFSLLYYRAIVIFLFVIGWLAIIRVSLTGKEK